MAEKIVGVRELDTISALTVQVTLFTRQLGSITANAIHTPVVTFEIYNGAHVGVKCQANSTYVQTRLEQAVHFIANNNR